MSASQCARCDFLLIVMKIYVIHFSSIENVFLVVLLRLETLEDDFSVQVHLDKLELYKVA